MRKCVQFVAHITIGKHIHTFLVERMQSKWFVRIEFIHKRLK